MWWQWQALWDPSRNPRNEKLSAHSTNVRQGRAIALGSLLHSVIICLHLMPLDIIRFENFSCSLWPWRCFILNNIYTINTSMFQYLRVALGKERMKPNAAWWLLLGLHSFPPAMAIIWPGIWCILYIILWHHIAIHMVHMVQYVIQHF